MRPWHDRPDQMLRWNGRAARTCPWASMVTAPVRGDTVRMAVGVSCVIESHTQDGAQAGRPRLEAVIRRFTNTISDKPAFWTINYLSCLIRQYYSGLYKYSSLMVRTRIGPSHILG